MNKVIKSFYRLFSEHRSSEGYYHDINKDVVGLGGKNIKSWMCLGYWKEVSFDRVSALDCAFHFNTREKFFMKRIVL